jgi:hypothetical protein
LFGYEKASKKQLRNVSDALGPVNDARRANVEAIESVVGLEKRMSEVNCSTSSVAVDDEKAKSVDIIISLSHAAIFRWHFSRSLRVKSPHNSDVL